ncbi:hypothetical protein [Cellvibrio sp. pealriver]|uniref:hypothetical protein n=1 Tax=Cellvibrio sp. pealriver TaxID=1622269 RepID=UPI00066FEE86|nr:hypothetical protein [Cellvibrio sp. pealriver]
MSIDPQIEQLLKRLIVPNQDLAQLGFCGGNKETHVKAWLQTLPLTQAQQVSGALYGAIHEVSRVRMGSEQRLAILELLRVPIHQTLNGLALKYLNQPLILPEAAMKTATVAQAIQKHFLNSYLMLVRELCTAPAIKDKQELQALVIHRAMTAIGLLMLRSYQLYLPIASQLWAELHALHQIACLLDVEQLPVEDRLPHHQGLKTIHAVYLRCLLLATARPNQLRQDEIESTYNLLEYFAPAAELVDYEATGKENLFVVLTDSNRPPFYKSHWRPANNPTGQPLQEIRTSNLVNKLQDQQKAGAEPADGQTLRNHLNLSAALTKHLAQVWSHLALRSFERQDVSAEIEVTVGLTNIHFYLAGEQPFNIFLNQSSAISGIPEKGALYQKRGVQLKPDNTKKADDPWGDAFDITGTALDGRALPTFNIEKKIKSQEVESYQGQHPIYTVPLMDRSAGGYGLEWRNEIPVQVRAGELLGLREYGRNKWSIGVVRWAHQIKGATQLGIQILAPQALPVGLAVVHKTGGFAEYLRALQIPELRAINQPPSLITNAISFHEYSKARLYAQAQPGVSYEGDKSIQLTQRLFATGSFSQFGFRELATAKPESKTSKDDFDSVWE